MAGRRYTITDKVKLAIDSTGLDKKLALLADMTETSMTEWVQEAARRFVKQATLNTKPLVLTQSAGSKKKEWVGKLTKHFNKHRVSKSGVYRNDAKTKRLIRHRTKELGRAAAGWQRAARALGVKGIPKWIQAHGALEGGFTQRITKDKCIITVSNSVPYQQEVIRKNAQFAYDKVNKGFYFNKKIIKRKLGL